MTPALSSPNAQELFSSAMEWLDAHWTEEGIQLDPALSYRGNTAAPAPHYIRETAFYSLGLFFQGKLQGKGKLQGSHQARALAALELVLAAQLFERESDFSGSFLRHPEESLPPRRGAKEWSDYNPNWREFIGPVLALILSQAELPDNVRNRTERALRMATAGSLWRRVPPEYTEIGMLKAFLLAFAGERHGLEAWVEGAEMQAREIFRLFVANHQALPHFNSPTDYGLVLWAMGLWRNYSSSPAMRLMAQEIQEALWHDIAQFYHPDLRNLAGPYERAFGMDLTQYASPLGLCLWACLGRQRAPFPELSRPFAQQHQLALAIPLLLAGGGEPPAGILPRLEHFQQERCFERLVFGSPSLNQSRVAREEVRSTITSWIAPQIMIGARSQEWASPLPPGQSQIIPPTRDPSEAFSTFPVTVHWKAGEELGWLSAQLPRNVQAQAKANTLTIRCPHPSPEPWRFLLHSPAPSTFALDKWSFPGLTVDLVSNVTFSAPAEQGEIIEIQCQPFQESPESPENTTKETEAFITFTFKSCS